METFCLHTVRFPKNIYIQLAMFNTLVLMINNLIVTYLMELLKSHPPVQHTHATHTKFKFSARLLNYFRTIIQLWNYLLLCSIERERAICRC